MADKSIAIDLSTLGQDVAQSRANVLSLSIEERKKRGLVTEKEFADYVIQQLDTTRSQEAQFSPISELETLPVDTDKLPDVAGQQIGQEFGSGISGLLEYGYESSLFKRASDALGKGLGIGQEQTDATNEHLKSLERKEVWKLATDGFSQEEQFKFLAVESRYPDEPGRLFELRDELLKERLLGQYASRTSTPGFIASMILNPDTLMLLPLPVARGLGKVGNIVGDIGIGAATGAAYDVAHQGLGYQDFNMDRVGESALLGAALQGGIRGITEPFARTPPPTIDTPPPQVPVAENVATVDPMTVPTDAPTLAPEPATAPTQATPIAETPNLSVAATEPVVDANLAQQATQPTVAPESTIEATPTPVAEAPKKRTIFVPTLRTDNQPVLKPVAPPPSPDQIAQIAKAVSDENNHVAAVNYSDNAAAQMVHKKDSKWKGDFTASLNTELNNKLSNDGIVLPERFGKVQELLGKSQGASGIHDFITESLVNTPATPQDLNIISNVIEQRHTQAINAINERVVALNGLKDPEVIAQKRAEISRAKEWLLTTERFATQLKRDFPNHPFPEWVNKQSKEHTLLYQTIDGKKTVTKSAPVVEKLISPEKIIPSSDLTGKATILHSELATYFEKQNNQIEGSFKDIVQPRNVNDEALRASRFSIRESFEPDFVTTPNSGSNWNNAPVLLRVLVNKQQAIDFGLTNLANKLGESEFSNFYLPISGNGRTAIIKSILEGNPAKASRYRESIVSRGKEMSSRYGMHNLYDTTTGGHGDHIYAQVLDLGSTDRPRSRKGETPEQYQQRAETAQALNQSRIESQVKSVKEIAFYTNKPPQATLDALAVARADSVILDTPTIVESIVEKLGAKNTLNPTTAKNIAATIKMTGGRFFERVRNMIMLRSFGDSTLAEILISETDFEVMIAKSNNKELLGRYRNDLKQTANELFVESAKKTDNAVENAKTAGLDVVGGLTATFNKLLTETEKIAPENIDSIIDAISKQGGLIDQISPAQRAFEERLLRNAVKSEKTVTEIVNDTLKQFKNDLDMFSVPKRPEPPVAAKPPKKPVKPEPVKPVDPVEQIGEGMPLTHADKLDIETGRLREEASFINKPNGEAIITLTEGAGKKITNSPTNEAVITKVKNAILKTKRVWDAKAGTKLISLHSNKLYLVEKLTNDIKVDANAIGIAINKLSDEFGDRLFIVGQETVVAQKNMGMIEGLKFTVKTTDGFEGFIKLNADDIAKITESEPGVMLDVPIISLLDGDYIVKLGDQIGRPIPARQFPEFLKYMGTSEYQYGTGFLKKGDEYRVIAPSAVKDKPMDRLTGGCD